MFVLLCHISTSFNQELKTRNASTEHPPFNFYIFGLQIFLNSLAINYGLCVESDDKWLGLVFRG